MLIPINLTCYSNYLTTKNRINPGFQNPNFMSKTHVYEQPTYDTITTRTIHEIPIKTWFKTKFPSIAHHTTQINKREKILYEVKGNLSTLS